MAPRKKLSRSLEKFEASLIKLNESLMEPFEKKYEKEILVELVTKRFEYTFESLWKWLKELLLEEGVECVTPLHCFKEAYKLRLISEGNQEIFPLMVKKRNEIVHVYSEDEAYEIYFLIKNTFAPAIHEIYQEIGKRQNKKA